MASSLAGDDLRILQIGGCDGWQSDSLYGIRDESRFSGVIMEPIPELAAELRENVPADRFVVVEKAIWTSAGREIITRINLDKIPRERRRSWMKGISTMVPGGSAASESGKWCRPNTEWGRLAAAAREMMAVETTTLDSVVRDFGVDKVDIYLTDMEGADIVAFRQFDLEEFRPALMMMEDHGHSSADRREMRERMRASGLVIIEAVTDVIGYDPERVAAPLPAAMSRKEERSGRIQRRRARRERRARK